MIPDNEFTNDLEYMASMDTAYHNVQKLEQESETFRMLRFKTRINESNAMKSDWQKEIKDWNKALLKNERNNGREDVYEAIRTLATGRIYFDSIEDMIQQCKIRLKGK